MLQCVPILDNRILMLYWDSLKAESNIAHRTQRQYTWQPGQSHMCIQHCVLSTYLMITINLFCTFWNDIWPNSEYGICKMIIMNIISDKFGQAHKPQCEVVQCVVTLENCIFAIALVDWILICVWGFLCAHMQILPACPGGPPTASLVNIGLTHNPRHLIERAFYDLSLLPDRF